MTGVHKVDGVGEAIAARGALLFLFVGMPLALVPTVMVVMNMVYANAAPPWECPIY
jgi:hypothetical protein